LQPAAAILEWRLFAAARVTPPDATPNQFERWIGPRLEEFPSASSAQASIDRLEALQRLEVAIDVASPSHTASDGANIGTGDGLTRAVFLAPCREPRSA
jgi:hypothetical protein